MHEWLGMKEPWVFHERLDSYYYAVSTYVPRILGTDIRQLGLRLTLDLAMFGIGGLMGMAVAASTMTMSGTRNPIVSGERARLETMASAQGSHERGVSRRRAPHVHWKTCNCARPAYVSIARKFMTARSAPFVCRKQACI